MRTFRKKNPQHLKFEYALRTLAMIREVNRELVVVRLSEISVGRLMKHLGLGPQCPPYRAWQQDPALAGTGVSKNYRAS